MNFDSTCPFCTEFERGYLDIRGTRIENRVIGETEHFVVFPALGPIVDGNLLIATKSHEMSMGSMPGAWDVELTELKRTVKRVLDAHYGPTFFFEHGPVSWNKKGGCCIEHAHMHAVPAQIDVCDELSRMFPLEERATAPNVLHTMFEINQPYIWVERHDGSPRLFLVPEVIPSQVVRKIIAKKIGRPEEWDWKRSVRLDEMERMMTTLRGKLV